MPRETETVCAKKFREKGWNVIQNGWPDLLVEAGGTDPRDLYFVEVKNSSKGRFNRNQRAMAAVLQRLGCYVYKWCPDKGLGLLETIVDPKEPEHIERWRKEVPLGRALPTPQKEKAGA